MTRDRGRGRAGVTLLEILLVGAIGPLLLAAALLVAASAVGLHRTATTLMETSLAGHRSLRRAGETLRHARGGSLDSVPASPSWTSSVLFDRLAAVGAVDGEAQWAPAILRLALAPGETDDGTDEDGDGLVDEHVLELVTDAGTAAETVTVLATDVAGLGAGEQANGLDDDGDGMVDEPGFCLSRDGALLTLRLTLQHPNGTSESFETSIRVRN